MRRCKLISPTNLMLEQPILGPVEESEYWLLGVKETKRLRWRWFFDGAMVGILAGLVIALIIESLKVLK